MSEKQTETSSGGQDMGPFKAGAPFKFADVQSLQLAIQAYFGAFGLKHGWVAGGMAVVRRRRALSGACNGQSL